jgi:dynein heavy chain
VLHGWYQVRKLSIKFRYDLQRQYYVTPTSYLELITTYKSLLGEKRKAVSTLEKRYRSGLEQIFSAEEQVGVMTYTELSLNIH